VRRVAARKRESTRSSKSKGKRALTRKVTRNEALSYEKTVPNKAGVTSLSEVNGPDAYRRRYEATRKMLGRGRRRASRGKHSAVYRDVEETPMKANYTPAQKRAMAKMTPKRRKSFQKMLAKAPSVETIRPGARKTRRTRKARANRALPPLSPAKQKEFEKGWERTFGKPKKKGAKAPRPKKADFVAAQMRKGRSKKQADAAWKLAYGAGRRKSAAKKKTQRRTYGKGQYRAVKARYGTTSRHTYMYKTKRGGTRHIPEHALLGFPSARAMKLAEQKPGGAERIARKRDNLQRRRARAAEKEAARIMAGKGIFTPNPGAEVYSFEEWKQMYKSNPKRKTRKKAKAKSKRPTKAAFIRSQMRKKRTKAQAEAAWKLAFGTKKKRTTKRKTTKRRKTAAKRTRKLTKAEKAAISRRNLKKARAAQRKKRGTKRRTTKRKTTKRRVSRAKSMTITMRANSTPAQRAAARRNIKKAQTARWRKNSSMRYEANAAQAFVEDMKGAVKIGAIVVTGYMAHRALTKVLNDHVLAKVETFQSGGLARWRDVIAGILVAAAGVPLAVRVVPRESAAAGAGMAASLLHSLIVTALTEAGQPEVVDYLSNYPNASAPAWPGIGSYYTFQPRQLYPTAGMGEYYSLGPGALTTGELTAAAAGMGSFAPMQAAAGTGALVTQAAAGQGEYLVYGAEGVGETYEEVPVSMLPSPIDEGIAPNVHSAEQALNVMEAAAGVGQADIPLQSTVNPLQLEVPIGDEPMGSRSGVFEGGGGIFG